MNPDEMQLDDGEATGKRRVRAKAPDTPALSEKEVYEASKAAAIELGVDPIQIAREAGAAGDYDGFNKLSPEEKTAFKEGRLEQQTQEREIGTPDNPQPYEAPPGANWNLYSGVWGLYYRGRKIGDADGYDQRIIDLIDNPEGGGAGGGGGGGGGDGAGDGAGGAGGGGAGAGGFYTASDGKTFTNSEAYTIYQSGLDEKKASRVSAYNILYDEFDQNGLGSLVSDIKNILVEGSLDPAEFSLKVRGTEAYKARFIANEARLAKGLKALSPAAYIELEDQYQDVMRRYGLPASYYTKTGTGVQEGFNKLIESDISKLELEDRIFTAQKRVLNANPEVTQAIKQFYPDITNADILAYTLDPKNAIENIKRKVTAAEIGGAAIQAGLQTGLTRAEQLEAAGVDKQSATEQYGAIAGGLQRGSQLASIYGEDPYTQTTAETERFNLAGAQEARKQRQKVTGLEKATFGGQSGISSGALTRDRAGAY